MGTGTQDTVGTTGAWHVLSNNINSVPREARIEIDIRDINLERRDAVVKSVHDKVKNVAEKRGVAYSIDMINKDPPATCADQVINNPAHLVHMCLCKKVESALASYFNACIK